MSVRCAWCDDPRASRTITASERQFRELGAAAQRYRVCDGCGSLTADAPFADLGRHYPTGYYAFGTIRDGALTRLLRGARTRHALGRGSWLGALVARRLGIPDDLAAVGRAGIVTGARILDIGAGRGRLLHDLVLAGERAVTGWDPFGPDDPGPPRLARDPSARRGPWDLVMYHHSLEHVDDPATELATSRDALAPGGRILVRLPLAGSHAALHYGADWVQLDAPRHRTIPTATGVRALAGRNGLRVVSAWQDSTAFQFWGSEHYKAGGFLREGDPAATVPAARMAAWTAEATARNAAGEGDQGAFVLARADEMP